MVADDESNLDDLRAFFDEFILPLLQADGADAEILGLEGSDLTIRVSGTAAYGVGSHYVRSSIIERGMHEVRAGLTVHYEKTAPRPVKVG